jgi:hypothetical protein
MKNLKILSLALFFPFTNAKAQCPTTSIAFATQAELNAFPTDFPSCAFLPDGVDVEIMGNDITDLTPLQQLTGSLGVFEIRDCPNLVSLTGMENFVLFGNDPLDGFILRDLPSLNSLTALSNLDSITGEFTIRTCAQLTNMNGFENLVYVNGSVIIRDNTSLASLEGFNNLKYIGETLELVQNTVLTDISALSNVDTIVGGIEGGVFIEANTILTSLTGLGNSTTQIGSNLDLLLNPDLTLCSVPSICNYLANPPMGAIITINGNLTGCNSELEIEAGCLNLSLSDINQNAKVFVLRSNIVEDFLTIETNTPTEIEIYSLTNEVGVFKIEQGIHSIAVNHLTPGIYFIRNEWGKILKWVKL